MRYAAVLDHKVPDAMAERVTHDAIALCDALGYDLNTVELAVRDGVPYAIDFMNCAPDADLHSVGQENFDWIVNAMSEFLMERARQPRFDGLLMRFCNPVRRMTRQVGKLRNDPGEARAHPAG